MDNVETVMLAAPPEFKATVPRTAAPSRNVITPFTVRPACADVAFAVIVTVCPVLAGFGVAVNASVVAMGLIVSTIEALLGLKFPEPTKRAVIVCAPNASVEVLKVADPAALRGTEPRTALPSLKVTVPVGIALPWAARTLATKLTVCTTEAGFGDAVSVVPVSVPSTIRRTGDELLLATFVSAPYVATTL